MILWNKIGFRKLSCNHQAYDYLNNQREALKTIGLEKVLLGNYPNVPRARMRCIFREYSLGFYICLLLCFLYYNAGLNSEHDSSPQLTVITLDIGHCPRQKAYLKVL